jgi:hypothetical protein
MSCDDWSDDDEFLSLLACILVRCEPCGVEMMVIVYSIDSQQLSFVIGEIEKLGGDVVTLD